MSFKKIKYLIVAVFALALFLIGEVMSDSAAEDFLPDVEPIETAVKLDDIGICEKPSDDLLHGILKKKPMPTSDYETLMARVVHGEAGNQDYDGKRLVADVILNRVDDPAFPDTIEGVCTQGNQFFVSDTFTQKDLQAVKDEIADRMDYDILYFRLDRFHSFGVPAYQHGDHYFSKGE